MDSWFEIALVVGGAVFFCLACLIFIGLEKILGYICKKIKKGRISPPLN